MRVEHYDEPAKHSWDYFVRQSKNGTFLFLRDYMDYHRDRFRDCSLLIYDDRDDLVALLPASRCDSRFASHPGLTYGGLVTQRSAKLPMVLQIFERTVAYLQAEGIQTFSYSTIPSIYHRVPAEEDRYALYLANARLTRRGVLCVIGSEHLPFQERRSRGAKKAEKAGVVVRQSEDWKPYWEIITDRLLANFKSAPVHQLSEIEFLAATFPDCIKLFAAYEGSVLIAGVVIYETDLVARAQYIAASDRGQELSAIDLIFARLLFGCYANKRYFEFGTSDEEGGIRVNKGLIDQKEGYGARVLAHDHYVIDVAACVPDQFVAALR